MEGLKRKVCDLAELIEVSNYTVALTGAGVSTESGIPDFRSKDSGLWQEVDPYQVASYRNFRKNPDKFYNFWAEKFSRLSEAEPNTTHQMLTYLEKKGLLKWVITQNIDNLHQKAGTENVLEPHGNYKRGYCIKCKQKYKTSDILKKVNQNGVPRCGSCGGLLKPDVVLFGESLPQDFQKSMQVVKRCNLQICLGTSLSVYPVADLVSQAKATNGQVAIINRGPTSFDHLAGLVIHGELNRVMEVLKGKLR